MKRVITQPMAEQHGYEVKDGPFHFSAGNSTRAYEREPGNANNAGA